MERKPPTIADIVRQKTDNGAHIVDFFLDLMEGRVDDAMLCHRIDAAKQLVKYGSKDAAVFIADHRDETCDHCESRKRGPRPRKDAIPAAGPLHASPIHAPGPYGYDFLTLLTEDFLTVLSAVDEDLMIMLLRAQTRDGGTVIDFLDNVMHGREDGFKAHHRIAAAKELISHILRDEHVTAHAVLDKNATAHALLDNVEPAPYSIRGADRRVRPLPGSETPSPSTGEGGEGDSSSSPVGAGLKPALPGAAWEPCNPESIVAANPTVVPAKAGFLPHEPSPTQRGGGARVAVANSADFEPVWSTAEGPKIVRPEPVEGQCSGDSAVPGPAPNEADLTVVPAKAGFLPQEPSPTQGGGGARSATTNSAHPELNSTVVPAKAGFPPQEPSPTQGGGGARVAVANSAHPELNSTVVPAKAGFLPQEPSPTQRGGAGRRSQPNSAHPEPVLSTNEEATEGSQLETTSSKLETLPGPAGRRIRQKLEAHRHEPDPRDRPIGPTTRGRSPPW